MSKKKIDLRTNEWREAIIELANAVQNISLNNRALAILIADCSNVRMTQALKVLNAIPKLEKLYLKPSEKPCPLIGVPCKRAAEQVGDHLCPECDL